MTEWYDFPNVKSTKMLSFLFGSRGLRPDLPSPFGRKFLFCLPGYYRGEDSDVDFEASRRSTRVQSKSTIRSALFLAKH